MADYTVFENELVKSGARFTRAEPLSLHTTVGIGGGADFLVQPKSVVELVKVAEIAQKTGVRYFFFGKGSNLLVSDNGFRGAAICTKGLNDVCVERDIGDIAFVRAFCGTTLQALNSFCFANGLSGVEFLNGIPGTVGGAITMNASFSGKSIADITSSVFAESGGRLLLKNGAECGFGYRKSVFQSNGSVVISALFRTKKVSISKIRENLSAYKLLRKSQPSGKSMGSVFKNGEIPAGKAVDAAGLKGFRVGGAYVSDKHANFILNDGTATASDVKDLIMIIKAVVKDKLGISLVEEIQYIGEFR
ncbi:MAG: UDP-N-acetylmuramate dehydrogenase [Clostridia bacterium]|nr:UDP-N-acetylmuramate dehydrogenase [Clostridia bacterium]